jgi:hypothetical protein
VTTATQEQPQRRPPGRPPRPAAERERALAAFRREGSLSAASRASGVPKSTLRNWLREEGEPPAQGAAEAAKRTEAATEAARIANAKRLEEARQALIPKLLAIAHASLDEQRAVLRAVRDPQERRTMGREHPVPVRDLVGMGTRAVHDLNVLLGKATDQPEETARVNVTVLLAAPDHDREPPLIVDVAPRALPGATSDVDDE